MGQTDDFEDILGYTPGPARTPRNKNNRVVDGKKERFCKFCEPPTWHSIDNFYRLSSPSCNYKQYQARCKSCSKKYLAALKKDK